MPSDVIEQKVTHLLRLCDRNGDGTVELADYEQWIGRLAAIRAWEPGSDGYTRLEGIFIATVGDMLAAYGGAIGPEQIPHLSTTLATMVATGTPVLQQWAEGFFHVIDADGDGVIGPSEYRELMASLAIDATVADESFAKIDLDGDGQLSLDEYVQLYVEFFTSDDPDAPGSWLWGPFA
jgi:Ca2+-binding EF-hand superfamily protein